MNKADQKAFEERLANKLAKGGAVNREQYKIEHNGFIPKSIVDSININRIPEDDGPNTFGTGSMPTASSGAKREKLHAMPYDLVPYQEITEAYIRAAAHGANNHGPWNWTLGFPRVQIICSLLRHAFAYIRGEDYDKKSGLLHTDHVLWNAVALTHSVHHGIEDDRRPEPPRKYKSL
jgi:Domain of unknown function (DUF5664)